MLEEISSEKTDPKFSMMRLKNVRSTSSLRAGEGLKLIKKSSGRFEAFRDLE